MVNIKKPPNAWLVSSVRLLVTRIIGTSSVYADVWMEILSSGNEKSTMWRGSRWQTKTRKTGKGDGDKKKQKQLHQHDHRQTNTAENNFFLLSYNIRAISSRLQATIAVDVGVVTGCSEYHIRPQYHNRLYTLVYMYVYILYIYKLTYIRTII